jgi:hypothetical protein
MELEYNVFTEGSKILLKPTDIKAARADLNRTSIRTKYKHIPLDSGVFLHKIFVGFYIIYFYD